MSIQSLEQHRISTVSPFKISNVFDVTQIANATAIVVIGYYLKIAIHVYRVTIGQVIDPPHRH